MIFLGLSLCSFIWSLGRQSCCIFNSILHGEQRTLTRSRIPAEIHNVSYDLCPSNFLSSSLTRQRNNPNLNSISNEVVSCCISCIVRSGPRSRGPVLHCLGMTQDWNTLWHVEDAVLKPRERLFRYGSKETRRLGTLPSLWDLVGTHCMFAYH